MVRGSCLCGDVAWEAKGPFELMSHCHCSMCRKTHATGFSTAIAAPAAGFRVLRGESGVARIFVDSKAAWHEITDSLPRFAASPPHPPPT